MGDYAEDMLRFHMRQGFRVGSATRRQISHYCPDCGKGCRGQEAVQRHMKDAHKKVISWGDAAKLTTR